MIAIQNAREIARAVGNAAAPIMMIAIGVEQSSLIRQWERGAAAEHLIRLKKEIIDNNWANNDCHRL